MYFMWRVLWSSKGGEAYRPQPCLQESRCERAAGRFWEGSRKGPGHLFWTEHLSGWLEPLFCRIYSHTLKPVLNEMLWETPTCTTYRPPAYTLIQAFTLTKSGFLFPVSQAIFPIRGFTEVNETVSDEPWQAAEPPLFFKSPGLSWTNLCNTQRHSSLLRA